MSEIDDKALIDAIRERLEQSLEALDPGVERRLDAARRAALQAPRRGVENDDEALVEAVRNTLEDNEAVSAPIQARLDQIRQQAVSQAVAGARTDRPAAKESIGERLRETFRTLLDSTMGVPAGMIASACVMVTVVSLFYVASRQGTLSVEDELILIASADDLELYENLDFYLWLADNAPPD